KTAQRGRAATKRSCGVWMSRLRSRARLCEGNHSKGIKKMKKLGTLLFTMGSASLLFACGGDGADLAEDSTANSSGGSASTAGGSAGVGGDGSGGMALGGGSGSGGMVGAVGGANSGGLSGTGGASGAGGNGPASGGNGAGGEFVGSGGQEGTGGSPNADCKDV